MHIVAEDLTETLEEALEECGETAVEVSEPLKEKIAYRRGHSDTIGSILNLISSGMSIEELTEELLTRARWFTE